MRLRSRYWIGVLVVLLGVSAVACAMMVFCVDPGPTDARYPWSGYAWERVEVGEVCRDAPETGCPIFHGRWDWKRDQWVDVSYAFSDGKLVVRQTATDNDPSDADYVCVTLLFLDATDTLLATYHNNSRVRAGSEALRVSSSAVPPHFVDKFDVVWVGTKQCREGALEDRQVYVNALKRTPGIAWVPVTARDTKLRP